MSQVFISYSAKDTNVARRIARDLQVNGIETWLAEEQILPGDSVENKIFEAIRRSDHFLVVLSERSLGSNWVQYEIAAALQRDAEAGTRRLIPVKIDDAPLPDALANVRYVDLRSDYESSIRQLVDTLKEVPAGPKANMADFVDARGVAKEIGRDQKGFKGSGYLVTTVLAVLTLVATGISAFSSYYEAFKNKPKVFFAVSQYQIPVPPHIEARKFFGVLEANGIPKTLLQVDVVNKGDASARLIKAGISLPNTVLFTDSRPPANPSQVWVKISVSREVMDAQNYVTYSLENLTPDKVVSAVVGYHSAVEDLPPVDVICDGKNARRLDTITQADQWSVVSPMKQPFQILAIGLVITLLVGFTVVIKSNSKLRNAFLLIIKEMNPTLARVFDITIKLAEDIKGYK